MWNGATYIPTTCLDTHPDGEAYNGGGSGHREKIPYLGLLIDVTSHTTKEMAQDDILKIYQKMDAGQQGMKGGLSRLRHWTRV